MQLSSERLDRVRGRLVPILKKFNSDMQFITVFVDSTREFLGVVAQIEDRPMLLKFGWIDFISRPDDDLQSEVFAQLELKFAPEKVQ